MVRLNAVALFQIGNRPGDSQNLVVRSRGKPHFVHRRSQQTFGLGLQLAMLTDLFGRHLAIDHRWLVDEAASLDFATDLYLLAHGRAVGAGSRVGQLAEGTLSTSI